MIRNDVETIGLPGWAKWLLTIGPGFSSGCYEPATVLTPGKGFASPVLAILPMLDREVAVCAWVRVAPRGPSPSAALRGGLDGIGTKGG